MLHIIFKNQKNGYNYNVFNLLERVIVIKNINDKAKMVIFLIFLISFFLILSIWYIDKQGDDERLVVAKNVKEILTIGEINIGLYNDSQLEVVDNINAIENNSEVVRFVSDLVYNGLFKFNGNLALESILVEDYAKIDEKNYAFKLKDDIYFQNGKKLTSTDIKNTIEKITLKEDSYYANCVKNIESVKVIDNSTFRINLINVEDNFENNLIFPILSDETNIGTNNYKIKEINNEKIVLENEAIGQVLNIYIYNNMEILYGDFKAKKLDLIKSIENIEHQKYIGEFGYQDKAYKGNKYICLKMNPDKYSENSKLEEAVLSAINCDEIIKKVLNNKAYDIKNVKYDLDKVIEILETEGFVYKDNGWYNENGLLNLKILVDWRFYNNIEIGNILKSQLEKVGIIVEMVSSEVLENFDVLNDKSENFGNLEEKENVGNLENIESLENPEDIANLDNIEDIENARKIDFDIEVISVDNSYNINHNIPDNAIICNKLNLLYSSNLSGQITPNYISIFNNIDTWKKIAK